MRVLFVWRFCGLGGVETALLQRITALARVGIEAEVLFNEQFNKGGRFIANDPRVHVGLSRNATLELLRRDWDLIAVPDFPAFMDVIQQAHIGTPVVLETHDSKPTLPAQYAHFESPRVAAIVVPSEFNRRLIAEAGVHPADVRVIPNALDTDAFRPRTLDEIAPAYREWAEGPIVLWIGRMEGEKNPAEFVAAAELVCRAIPSARFVMVGDTWDSSEYEEIRASLEAEMSPALAARLRWQRHVPPAEMPQVVALAGASGGCLVSTSRNESQPMIFLEAMASGCPIVSSDVDGPRELLEGRGIGRLYPLGAPQAAAAAVIALLAPEAGPARAEMTERGRAIAVAEHSLDAMGAAFARLLDDVAIRASGGEDGPLVSAVIIFLDGENFLAEAIESVLAQTYRHWELILVDDGSTDGSTAIAKGYAERDPRIRYVEHAGHANRGKSVSRNRGLQEARGRYVALLDHDDAWLPNKLADQVAALEARPEVGAIFGRTRYWYSWSGRPADRARDGTTILVAPPDAVCQPPDLVTRLLADERGLPTPCSLLVRRELALSVGGFDEAFPNIYDDVVFFYKLFLEAPVYVADACWDSYRQHGENSVAGARLAGEWHPRRPNPRRFDLLSWLEQHLAARGTVDQALAAELATQLRPYREAARRTLAERYYDACFDGGLAVLRGEDPRPVLEEFADQPEPGLDPLLAAEGFFDALDPTTDIAASQWLDVWHDCHEGVETFFEALEARSGTIGIARQGATLLRRLIEGEWWLRDTAPCAARLRLQPAAADAVRVEIAAADSPNGWDIQLNRPAGAMHEGQALSLAFRARADAPRAFGLGVARNEPGWDNLGLYDRVAVGPEWTTVERHFTVTADAERTRVHFDLAGDDASVEVRELVVRDLADGRVLRHDGPRLREAGAPGGASGGAGEEPVEFGSFRRLDPIAPDFGIRRGQPIDRVYIEQFIGEHAEDISGRVLELEDPNYTRRFGRHRVTASDVLHVVEGNPRATIVADLTQANPLPDRHYDCVILTQALQFIYDVPAAIRTVRRILKPGGVVLATVPGISQVPEVEEGCNWCWTFTAHSAGRLFGDVFGAANVTTASAGNVLTAVSLLHGITAGELTPGEFAHADPNYPVIVFIRAVKA